MRARPATPDDAAAIALVYNEGIAGRVATFETRFELNGGCAHLV
jgi:L-amino acid N-acyltransferase YncA